MAWSVALDLWLAYNERLLAVHAATPFPLVDFDTSPGRYVATVDALAGALGLPGNAAAEDEFFEPGLRTDASPEGRDIPAAHLAAHAALLHEAARWRT
jgi:hypothetical protein